MSIRIIWSPLENRVPDFLRGHHSMFTQQPIENTPVKFITYCFKKYISMKLGACNQ